MQLPGLRPVHTSQPAGISVARAISFVKAAAFWELLTILVCLPKRMAGMRTSGKELFELASSGNGALVGMFMWGCLSHLETCDGNFNPPDHDESEEEKQSKQHE